MIAILPFLIIFIGCATKPPPMEPASVQECQTDEFRGFGVGTNENEALAEAHSALSRQISSSVNVTIERVVSQQVSNGKEDLASGYESHTVIESNLSNAHDARIVRNKRNGNKVNVIVCMTKSDAAKGFLERQKRAADSLEMVSSAMLSTEHPRQKNEAWHKTQMLWMEFTRLRSLLEGWGIESPYSEYGTYAKAREDYKNYCQNLKVFWQDVGNECSNAVFAVLSKKIKIEKSECTSGLNMKFNCTERCKSSSYGIECAYDPSLSIESCGGESYSLLKAQTPATGIDIGSESKAREKLTDNLPKAAFLSEWEKEIKEWVPKCAY